MEPKDLELINTWKEQDSELAKLWQEHLEYEDQLQVFNKRLYLSNSEELERKTIQKKKLQGRDQIEKILAKYR